MAQATVHRHDGHLLLYTLSHIELLGNAPVRPGYNELTLQLATAACHVQVLESYHLRSCIQQALKQTPMEACLMNETYLASVHC
jgi:hypothetical protein